MTMVNGVGAWVGSILSGMAVDYFSVDGVKDWQTIWLVFAAYALALAIVLRCSLNINTIQKNCRLNHWLIKII